jgi:hypothetical protein
MMKYFYNPKRKNTAAHIWVGGDTACTMLSTGGMKKGKKSLYDHPDGRRICAMCETNHAKQENNSIRNSE